MATYCLDAERFVQGLDTQTLRGPELLAAARRDCEERYSRDGDDCYWDSSVRIAAANELAHRDGDDEEICVHARSWEY